MIILLVAFAILLVAGGVGLFFALRSVADRLSVSTNQPMPAVSLPAGSPGPSLALPPIHGVTVSQVTATLQARGYRCTDTRHIVDTWITSCTLTDQNGVLYAVSLVGPDSTSVGLISAAFASTSSGQPTSAQASQFFSIVVGAAGQGGQASQASSWIRQNLDAGGDTTVGNLRLHLGRPGTSPGPVLVVTSSSTG